MTIEDYRPLELMLDPNITKSEFNDFIGVWPNFVPKPFCRELVEYADQVIDSACIYSANNPGLSQTGQNVVDSSKYYGGDLNRKDFSFMMDYANRLYAEQINSILRSCLGHYVFEYQSLKQVGMITTDIKMQRTPPGGGYHLWHHENTDIQHMHRELVWMIYLNDMPDGEGETEFMYQRRRIKPTAGTVVVWPGGFTHAHKGNTVLTTDKYIITGWYIKLR